MAIFVSGLGAIERANTKNAEFRRWFGKSVVRNPDGSPKVVYHGTLVTKDSPHGSNEMGFTVFKPSAYGNLGPGIYLTDDAAAASKFAMGIRAGSKEEKIQNSRVIPLYVRMERPIPEELSRAWMDWLFARIERTYYGSNAIYLLRDMERAGVDLAHAETLPERYEKAVLSSHNYAEKVATARILAKLKAGNFRMSDFLHSWKWNNGWNRHQGVDTIVHEMLAHGFDGVILPRMGDNGEVDFIEYLVPSPNQVKSVFNQGTWSREDDDILNGLRRR